MPTLDIDLIGNNPANLIVPVGSAEEKTLIQNDNLNNRVFQPVHAPFFADDFKVEFQPAGTTVWTLLTENADYKLAYKFVSAGLASGKRVYAAVIINSGNSAGKIRFKQYRSIGGPWADDKAAAIATIINTPYDHRTVFWDQVHGIPDDLPLTSHTLAATDLTVHNDLVNAINGLAAIVSANDSDAVLNYLLCNADCGVNCDPVDRNYINGILERVRTISNDIETRLNSLVNQLGLEYRHNDVPNSVGLGTGPSDNTEEGVIAIGFGAGTVKPDTNSVNIGLGAGRTNDQALVYGYADIIDPPYSLLEHKAEAAGVPKTYTRGQDAVNIGLYAGENYAGNATTNVGRSASRFGSASYVVSIGENSAYGSADSATPTVLRTPRFGSINVGASAGSFNAGELSTTIGFQAGYSSVVNNTTYDRRTFADGTAGAAVTNTVQIPINTGERTVNLGYRAGFTVGNMHSVNVGAWAGHDGADSGSINVGYNAGKQATENSINIGAHTYATAHANPNALVRMQNIDSTYLELKKGQDSVNIGWTCGRIRPGMRSFNVGYGSGYTDAGDNAINVGQGAGYDKSGFKSVSIGYNAGRIRSPENSINIGDNAGLSNTTGTLNLDGFVLPRGARVINIGLEAGKTNAVSGSISIGVYAGKTNTSQLSVNIGYKAAQISNGAQSINIGYKAGESSTGLKSINIGVSAGITGSGIDSINIGQSTVTGTSGVAVGSEANSGAYGVAVGSEANSWQSAVSIGAESAAEPGGVAIGALSKSPSDSMVIGKEAGSSLSGPASGITCLNAHGVASLPVIANGYFFMSNANGGSISNYSSASNLASSIGLTAAQKTYCHRRLVYVDNNGFLKLYMN